jgi:hypothetical protein
VTEAPAPSPAPPAEGGDSRGRMQSFGDFALAQRAMQPDSPVRPEILRAGWLEKKGGKEHKHAFWAAQIYT